MNKIALLFPFILIFAIYMMILWVVHDEELPKVAEEYDKIDKESTIIIGKPLDNTVESLTTQHPLIKKEEDKPLIDPNIVQRKRNAEPLCALISNRTDITVSADVRGNLGPAEVVLNEKVDNWLKDRL